MIYLKVFCLEKIFFKFSVFSKSKIKKNIKINAKINLGYVNKNNDPTPNKSRKIILLVLKYFTNQYNDKVNQNRAI
ncbi:hypothetical protein BLM37_01110 [Candidatus Gracilibacteria bacterium GN02-873]|nr:hypothetical protein BLM37_01110 [Candidatus Gracilibacteria bacterium GN02-873]